MDSLGESPSSINGQKTQTCFKFGAWSFHEKDHKQHCAWHGGELGCMIQAPPVLLALNCLTEIEQQQIKAFGHLLLEICGIFLQQSQCQQLQCPG